MRPGPGSSVVIKPGQPKHLVITATSVTVSLWPCGYKNRLKFWLGVHVTREIECHWKNWSLLAVKGIKMVHMHAAELDITSHWGYKRKATPLPRGCLH